MSSLRPTSLVIGNEDDDGEFNPFSHVGALLSGGGGGVTLTPLSLSGLLETPSLPPSTA